jgi:queuine tRNA-ribosyltransferase
MGKIEDIEHGLKFGITIFEINYPFYLAENQIALIKTEKGKYIEKKPERTAELEPLDANCKCYACERHSESYIAHLIECYEMNAKVLLSIHNIQNYIDYLDQFS